MCIPELVLQYSLSVAQSLHFIGERVERLNQGLGEKLSIHACSIHTRLSRTMTLCCFCCFLADKKGMKKRRNLELGDKEILARSGLRPKHLARDPVLVD